MFALVVVSGYTSINAVGKSRAFSRRRAGFGRWFSLRHRRFTFSAARQNTSPQF